MTFGISILNTAGVESDFFTAQLLFKSGPIYLTAGQSGSVTLPFTYDAAVHGFFAFMGGRVTASISGSTVTFTNNDTRTTGWSFLILRY